MPHKRNRDRMKTHLVLIESRVGNYGLKEDLEPGSLILRVFSVNVSFLKIFEKFQRLGGLIFLAFKHFKKL